MAVLRIHVQLKFDIVRPEHKSGEKNKKKRKNEENKTTQKKSKPGR